MYFKQEVVQFLVNFDKPHSWTASFSVCLDEPILVDLFCLNFFSFSFGKKLEIVRPRMY